MFKPFGKYSQAKRLRVPDGFFARLPIGQDPRQVSNFRNPSAVGFLFNVNCVHDNIIPLNPARE